MSDPRAEKLPPARFTPNQIIPVALTLILILSFALKLHNLGHLALKGLDESFHAIVAANLLERPFTPTMIAQPYLPYEYRDWQNNHVWLHKGIVPLWQISASYLIFGVETFALRLPSAILSTAAVLLTYLIGRELLNCTAALIAATLQAFSPAILMLVHGYAFSDHIDIALLFWVQLGIYFVARGMRTASRMDAIFAGVAQGLAFLSKMYPALIVTGIALACWVLPRLRNEQTRFSGSKFCLLILATVVTASPWLISLAIRFPQEFRYEYFHALAHLTHDIEQWGAPWDRLIFGYLLAAFYVFYPSVIIAAVVLLVQALREKNVRLGIVLAWAFGVLFPFTIAASKTPSATLIGWPAFFLLFGEMISRAVRGQRWMLGTWFIAIVAAVFFTGRIDPRGMGGEAGQIMRQNLWILWHVLVAMALGGALVTLLRFPHLRVAVILLSTLGTIWLVGQWMERAWAVTQINANEPAFLETAAFVRSSLPKNAVLLLEEREKLERTTLMFRARRTVYSIDDETWHSFALEVVERGGIPVIVSHRDWPLRAIYRSSRDGRTIYQLTP